MELHLESQCLLYIYFLNEFARIDEQVVEWRGYYAEAVPPVIRWSGTPKSPAPPAILSAYIQVYSAVSNRYARTDWPYSKQILTASESFPMQPIRRTAARERTRESNRIKYLFKHNRGVKGNVANSTEDL